MLVGLVGVADVMVGASSGTSGEKGERETSQECL